MPEMEMDADVTYGFIFEAENENGEFEEDVYSTFTFLVSTIKFENVPS